MSSVNGIHQALTAQIRANQTLGAQSKVEEVQAFNGLLSSQILRTNKLQHQADLETEKFLTGESENIHDMLIATEEASIALDLTVEVRNKMVEWYQEFKNMPL